MNMNLLSDRLKWCIEKKSADSGLRVTQTLLSKMTGVSRAAVNHWFSDTNGISTEAAIILADYFDVSYKWLETGEGKLEADTSRIKKMFDKKEIDISDTQDFLTIKRVDLKISAGITGYSIEYLDGDKAPIVFRKDWVLSKGYEISSLFALKVSGHSMETSLYDDDLVVINVGDTKLIDGEVYAVNYEGELVIKRLIRQGFDWMLSSDNTDKRKYPNKLCHENCFVIGKVIYKQSERI